MFKPVASIFRCCSAWGGWGGIRTSFILRPCPKQSYLQCFHLFVQHAAQRMWNKQDTLSQASMSFATMPEALVFAVLLRLCTIYCTRMWNKESCHKRPCSWQPCPEHWYFYSAFLSLRLAGCESGLTHSISETEAQCNKEWNLVLTTIISWTSNYSDFPPNGAQT